MQTQATSVRVFLAFPLLLALLAAPARAQDGSGGCVVSESGPTGQAEASCPSVEAEIEKHGSTSLMEANATLITNGEDVSLGLTAISRPSRAALSADEVSFLYGSRGSGDSDSQNSDGRKRERLSVGEDGVRERVTEGKNDEGKRVVSTIYLIGLSGESLQRIANSEAFRVKAGKAVFDFSESPMPAQAKTVLEAR
jgi:hypothetical protein